VGGGRAVMGSFEEPAGGWTPEIPAIRLRPRRGAVLLGVDMPRGEIRRRLRALGAECRSDAGAFVVTPPSHRGDLEREEDLVEEVARLGGYDAIPVRLPEMPLTSGEDSRTRLTARRLRRLLIAEGPAGLVPLAVTDAAPTRREPGFR